ncbi:MAG: SCO family protein [Gemmatimonadetes bacterium]|nr:SCO family protein [Gemmatimonadota bacterium]
MLLIGQPIGMFALLMAVAGDGVRETLTSARRSLAGRAGLGAAALVLIVGAVLAGGRVRGAVPDAVWLADAAEVVPDTYPRLDRTPPLLGLVNQAGDTIRWDRFVGSKVIVTFGFGHCETICPLMVHNANRVQEKLRAEGEEVPVVVITLDPWRDTPSRLPHLADQFMMGPGGHVLSGPVDEVNRVLDGLQMARQRDLQTGDIIHPSLVYLLDETGVVAYGATGHAPLIEELLRRL